MKRRKGQVRLDGEAVGVIEELEGGVRFTYSSEWLQREDAVPISLTLPLRAEPYISKGLHPFFEKLLTPDWPGWDLSPGACLRSALYEAGPTR